MSRTLAATLVLAASVAIPPGVASLAPAESANAVLWLGLLVQLGWLGLALGGGLLTEQPIPVAMGWVRGRLPALAWLPAMLGFLLASAGVHQLLVELELRDLGQLAEIDRSLRDSRPSAPWLAPLVAGLLPGLAEETLFRGFVLGRLRRVTGPLLAVVVSAAAFGVVHYDWIHGGAAFVLGLYLGTLALLSRSIWPCVLAHAGNNLMGVIAIQSAPGAEATGVALHPAWALGLSALLLLGTALFVRRRERHRSLRGEPTAPPLGETLDPEHPGDR